MENTRSLRELFSGAETKVVSRAITLFIIGLLLIVIGHIALEITPVNGLPEILISTKNIIGGIFSELGTAAIVASITIFLVDIGLRKEMMTDMERIVKATQPSQYINSFQPHRKDYGEFISSDIQAAKNGETIDIIGISLSVVCRDSPGIEVIQQKVLDGCNFRLLMLHPESSLVDCIQNLSKDYGYPDLRDAIRHNVRGKIRLLITHLLNQRSKRHHFGSIEIRLYKDIVSTLAYYASQRTSIIGLYYAHSGGGLSPAYQASEQHLIQDARAHFDALWEHSNKYILAKVDSSSMQDNWDIFFPEDHASI